MPSALALVALFDPRPYFVLFQNVTLMANFILSVTTFMIAPLDSYS